MNDPGVYVCIYLFVGACMALGVYFVDKPRESEWTREHYFGVALVWPLILGGKICQRIWEAVL